MRVGDETVGTIELIYRHHGPSPPTRYLRLLLEMADQAAGLIRLLRDDVERRHSAELAYTVARPRQTLPVMPAGDAIAADDARGDTGSETREPFLVLRCLGPFELLRQGLLITPRMFKRRKALTLLKILLLHAGQPVASDTLIEALWPEIDPHKGANRLYVVVHALREIVEPDGTSRDSGIIRTDGDRYMLAPEGHCWLDLSLFHDAILRGQQAEARGDRQAALAAYGAAVHLYRGDLFEDEPFAEWCWLEREQLREIYLGTLRKLAELAEGMGDQGLAINTYRRALQVDPLREETQRRFIACLWSSGRRDEALLQYDRLRTLLRQELGITPLPETEALVRRICQADPH